jgi:uncharacterized membrane protein YqhA
MDQGFQRGQPNVQRLRRLLVAQADPDFFIPQEKPQSAEDLGFAQRGLFQPARGSAKQLQGPARVVDRFRGDSVGITTNISMIALISKVKSFASKGAHGIENTFEWCLWKTRLVVHVAVAASLVTAFGLFLITAVDVVRISASFLDYSNLALSGDHGLSPEQQQQQDDDIQNKRADIQADTVELIDNCLLATIMVIFAFGLYELFISKIDGAERSGLAQNLLLIRSFDDLKERRPSQSIPMATNTARLRITPSWRTFS